MSIFMSNPLLRRLRFWRDEQDRALREETEVLRTLFRAKVRARVWFWAAAMLLHVPAINAITLDWNRNPEPEVTGYKVYIGSASHAYTRSILTTENTLTLSNLPPGTNFFAVTAVAPGQESDYSDEIFWVASLSAPTALHFRGTNGTSVIEVTNHLLAGLEAVWEMDAEDNVSENDATGHARTLVLTLGTSKQSAIHVEGAAALADGARSVFFNPLPVFKSTGSFTIVARVSANNIPLGSQEFWMRRNVTDVWELFTDGAAHPVLQVRSREGDASKWQSAISTLPIAGASFQTVVWQFDEAALVGRVSVDGEPWVETPMLSPLSESNSSLQFSPGGAVWDETAYWSRALSLYEVKTNIHLAGAAGFYSSGKWTP